jgi:hypothetical protein
MKIRRSPEGTADFAEIVEYIHKQNPSAADRVATPYTILSPHSHRFTIAGVQTGSMTHLVLAPASLYRCVSSQSECLGRC